MAADFWFNSAGTWRLAKNLWFNDAGTWRTVKTAWFNDAGTWRKVFSSATVGGFSFNITKYGLAGSTHTGTVNLLTDGSITHSITGSGTDGSSPNTNWYAPTTTGIGASYWVKYTLVSGNAWSSYQVGGTLYQLSSNNSISWTALTGQNKIATVRVDFYTDAGGVNLAGTGTIYADVESNN